MLLISLDLPVQSFVTYKLLIKKGTKQKRLTCRKNLRMDQLKLDFIAVALIPLLRNLSPETQGQWGRMNARQMVEHLSGFFQVSTGKLQFPLVTPEEHLPKYLEFLRSDKQFRENTKAPILPDDPMPLRLPDLEAAIDELQTEITAFLQYFERQPSAATQHPVFGNLHFDDWVLLHYKHVSHHLRQFNLFPGEPEIR